MQLSWVDMYLVPNLHQLHARYFGWMSTIWLYIDTVPQFTVPISPGCSLITRFPVKIDGEFHPKRLLSLPCLPYNPVFSLSYAIVPKFPSSHPAHCPSKTATSTTPLLFRSQSGHPP